MNTREPGMARETEAEPNSHLRSAALSGLVSAAGMLGCLFLSGILNARALGPTDRGYFALLTLVVSVVCQLGAFGTSIALTHFVAGRQLSARHALHELRGVIATQVAGSAVLVLALGLILNLDHPGEVRTAAFVVTLAVFTSYGRDYGLALLQGCRRNTLGNLLRVLPAGLWVAFIGVTFVAFRGSLLAAITSFVLADGLGAAVILLAARRAMDAPDQQGIECSVKRPDIVRYGRRGFLGFLSPLENFSLDQLYVSLSSSATNLGYYATASAFTNIPRVIAVNLGMTASPIVAAAESRGASRRAAGLLFIGLTMAVTVVFTVILAVAITYLIPFLFGEGFRPAIHLCQILLASGPIMALRRVLVDVLRGAGRPAGALAEVFGLILFALAAPILGSAHGPAGVAWAFVVATSGNLALLLGQEFRHRKTGAGIDVEAITSHPIDIDPATGGEPFTSDARVGSD